MPASLALRRPASSTLVGVAGFALALAAASQIAVPIPGTPVPFTLQPLVVVLAGLWLGPVAGAASMLFYLAAGAAGLPVFAPVGLPGVARFLGPTGGYLMAYPVAAFAAGWAGLRARTLAARTAAALLGVAVILLGGLAHLAVMGGAQAAFAAGVHPFVPLDFVKAFIAALLAPRRAARGSA